MALSCLEDAQTVQIVSLPGDEGRRVAQSYSLDASVPPDASQVRVLACALVHTRSPLHACADCERSKKMPYWGTRRDGGSLPSAYARVRRSGARVRRQGVTRVVAPEQDELRRRPRDEREVPGAHRGTQGGDRSAHGRGRVAERDGACRDGQHAKEAVAVAHWRAQGTPHTPRRHEGPSRPASKVCCCAFNLLAYHELCSAAAVCWEWWTLIEASLGLMTRASTLLWQRGP